jgi:hypothetical protein
MRLEPFSTGSLFVALALVLVSPDRAVAGPCDGMDKEVKAYSAKLNQTCVEGFVINGVEMKGWCSSPPQDDKKKAGVIEIIKMFWNALIAKGDGAASIGPRQFVLGGAAESGTVVGPTQRLWFANNVPSDDKVTVTVKETEGKAKTTIHVCELPIGAEKPTLRKSHVFNDTDASKKNEKESASLEVTGVKGKLVLVKVDGNSAALKFGYQLSVK